MTVANELKIKQLQEKVEALEEVYSRIVVAMIEQSAALNVSVEFLLRDATPEERREFANEVNELQVDSARVLKRAIDDVRETED